MSIIADALKKAQGKSGQRVEEPPPFDLKKGEGPAAAPLPPSPKPPLVEARAQAGAAVPTAVKAAPRAVPVQKGAAPKAKSLAARRWNIRIPVIFAVILVAFSGLIYYINRIYLPNIQKGGIALTEQGAETLEKKADTGLAAEIVIPDSGKPDSALNALAAPEKAQDSLAGSPESALLTEKPAETPEQTAPSAPAADKKPAADSKAKPPAAPLSVPAASDLPQEIVVPPQDQANPPLARPPAVPFDITSRQMAESRKLPEDIYHFNMAVYFQRRNDFQSALAEYAEVIRLTPENAEVYSNMGVLYNQIGEYGQAVAVLQKALLIDTRYSKAHNNIGLAYYKSGQYEQALGHLTRATELEPANLESYNNLGLVYKALGEVKKAEEIFLRALALDRGYTAAHYNLGLLYDETGRLREAREHYEAFIAGGGGTPELTGQVQRRIEKLTLPKAPGSAGF